MLFTSALLVSLTCTPVATAAVDGGIAFRLDDVPVGERATTFSLRTDTDDAPVVVQFKAPLSQLPLGANYSATLEVLPSRGLVGVRNVVVVHFDYGACGINQVSALFLWTGTQLVAGPMAISVFDEESSLESSFAWPGEKGGSSNAIVITTVERASDRLPTTRSESWSWNGAVFSKPTH